MAIDGHSMSTMTMPGPTTTRSLQLVFHRASRLRELSQTAGCTPSAVVQAAYAVTLQAYSPTDVSLFGVCDGDGIWRTCRATQLKERTLVDLISHEQWQTPQDGQLVELDSDAQSGLLLPSTWSKSKPHTAQTQSAIPEV